MCEKGLAVGTLFCMSWRSLDKIHGGVHIPNETDKVLLLYIGEDKVVLLGDDYAKVLNIPSFVHQVNNVKYVSSSPSETGITSLSPKFMDFVCDTDEGFYDDYDGNCGTDEDSDDDTGYEEESTGDDGSTDYGYYVIDSDWDVLTKEFKSFEEAKEWITHSLYDISDLSVAKKYN